MRKSIVNPHWSHLDLETTKGNQISNYQDSQVIDKNIENGCRDIYKNRYPAMVERTTSPTSIYNCHGMVFGSRRTQIDESTSVRKILEDDGYKKVSPENVMAGDVIIYIVNGDIEHSGIVVHPPIPENFNQAIIISKWGPFTEVLHPVHQSPYDSTTIEYYRIDK